MADTYKLQRPAKQASGPNTPAQASAEGSGLQPDLPTGRRLTSLDAYRGFVMVMLAAGGFGIARLAQLPPDNSVWKVWDYDTFQRLRFHFTHTEWESITGLMGVSFWDLIQPCFMFIVGVAMPFSYARRTAMGSSSFRMSLHALMRAVSLTLLGVFLYSLNRPQTNWVFTNVLAQIGLGYFFVYLLLGRGTNIQLAAVGIILVGYWGLFVLNPPPPNFDYAAGPLPEGYVVPTVENGQVYEGRFAPWSKNSNIAHRFDVWFLNLLRQPQKPATENRPADATTTQTGENQSETSSADEPTDAAADQQPAAGAASWWETVKTCVRDWWFSSPEPFVLNPGGYVTLNFVPSMATTLLGVLCGQLLMNSQSSTRKLLQLIIWGAVCIALGVLAHHFVCPIIKRIWTPSWALFSGGYAIWMLAGFYLVFDVLPLRKLAFPLVIVGMNSLAVYLMGQMMRPWTIRNVVKVHFGRMLQSLIGPDALNADGMGAMVLPTAAFVVFWLIALWMYRRRYFVRL